MVELIVLEFFEIRLVLDHLIEETLIFGMRVDDQQDDEEDIEKERVDGADQGLIVNRLDEYHVSAHKQQREKTCEYVQKSKFTTA